MEEILPALIILDLMLPKKNGFEVLASIRQNMISKGIPVIIISNLGQPDDIKRCEDLGISAFIIKSGSGLDAICKKIEEILQKK